MQAGERLLEPIGNISQNHQAAFALKNRCFPNGLN